jgi:hypothetical protein
MGNLIKMVEYRKGALSVEKLKSILEYDSETGHFTWLVNKGRRGKVGSFAGSLNAGGYVVIKIDSIRYLAHRLAWLYMTGAWPVDEIDHKDGITYNNKWLNLREAYHFQNSKNRKININNTSAFKGVSNSENRIRSKINVNGRQINLGTFDSIEEAHAAYVLASKFYHGEFANDGEA